MLETLQAHTHSTVTNLQSVCGHAGLYSNIVMFGHVGGALFDAAADVDPGAEQEQ